MFDVFQEASLSSRAFPAAPTRGGARGPKLVLTVFVIAIGFDLIAKAAAHCAVRLARRILRLAPRPRAI